MDVIGIRAGATTQSDGSVSPIRGSRTGAVVTASGQGKYYEATSRGSVYSLVLTAWGTAIAAGNLLAAAAAASTQFAVWNPAGSGVNLSLLKLGLWIISGTTPVAGVFHCKSITEPSIATAVVTPIANNNTGKTGNCQAKALTHSTGAALTGGSALTVIRAADFSVSAGTFSNLAGTKAIEIIDGDIVVAPGTAWVPVFAAAGTSVLGGWSVTWEEIPI